MVELVEANRWSSSEERQRRARVETTPHHITDRGGI